jgi:hypothetical protein
MSKWIRNIKVQAALGFAAGYYVGKHYSIGLVLKKDGQ